jgi:hypothetical protein
MPIIAYLDEYPWMRCGCGWTLNWDMNSVCPGCGVKKDKIKHLDRFGYKTITMKNGIAYKCVPWEDRNRMQF